MSPGHRRIWRLTISRVLAMGGGSAFYVALTYQVYTTTRSTGWLAAVTFATISVVGLLTPIAGWLADHYDRRRLMVASDLAVAGSYLVLLLAHDPLTVVLLAALNAVFAAPFQPASRAAIPNLVDEQDLTWANSMVARAFALSFTTGPVVGGILLGVAGAHAVFVLAAGLTVASALFVASMDGTFAQPTRVGEEARGGAREGFRYIAHHRLLRALVASEVVAFSGVGFAIVADAPLASQFHAGALGYGLLLASWGSGNLVGATLAPRLSRYGDDLQRVIAGMFLLGLSIATCWVLPWFWLILVVSVAGGFGNGIVDVCRQTLVQTHTPDEVRGRVFAAADGVGSLSFAASFAVAGAVVGAIGPQGAYGVCGLLFMSGAGLVVVLTRGGRMAAEAT